MKKTKLVSDVVKQLRSLADAMEVLVGDTQPVQAPKAKPPTLEEVRAVLVSLVQAGKQPEVKELITSFGAEKLSDVPATAYPEVLKQAEAL